MKYVEMTIKEALELANGNMSKTVLVAVQDLEKNESAAFVKKDKYECVDMIAQAQTIINVCDDIIKQLRLFTERQVDIRHVEPHGIMKTILYKQLE